MFEHTFSKPHSSDSYTKFGRDKIKSVCATGLMSSTLIINLIVGLIDSGQVKAVN